MAYTTGHDFDAPVEKTATIVAEPNVASSRPSKEEGKILIESHEGTPDNFNAEHDATYVSGHPIIETGTTDDGSLLHCLCCFGSG
jgi:hypothetical protein